MTVEVLPRVFKIKGGGEAGSNQNDIMELSKFSLTLGGH